MQLQPGQASLKDIDNLVRPAEYHFAYCALFILLGTWPVKHALRHGRLCRLLGTSRNKEFVWSKAVALPNT